jgi:hypothetical protein
MLGRPSGFIAFKTDRETQAAEKESRNSLLHLFIHHLHGPNTELERGAAGGQTPSSLEETNFFSEQGKHRCIILV